jgi:hypothetical protein
VNLFAMAMIIMKTISILVSTKLYFPQLICQELYIFIKGNTYNCFLFIINRVREEII